MPFDPHRNFAISSVATPPSPAASGTSLVLSSGEGGRFPDPAVSGAFNCVIRPAASEPTPANAEVVRVTARSGDTLTITRAQESSSARSVITGDVIYLAVTAKVMTDIEAVTPGTNTVYIDGTTYAQTRAGIQAAFDANPGKHIEVPPGVTITFDATPLSITATHNKTRFVVPPSSSLIPVQNSTNYNMISVAGTTSSSTSISAGTRGSPTLTVTSSASFAAGDEILAALTTTNTWVRSQILSIPDGTHVTLTEPLCFNATGGTLSKVTPVLGIVLDLRGDGSGNTGGGTSLIDSQYTSHCEFIVHARDFGGAAHQHNYGYMDECNEVIEVSGQEVGVGDYGDFYSIYSTSCRYRIQSLLSQGFGPYLSHCHLAEWDLLSVKGAGRGLKWSTSCGYGSAQCYGADDTGISLADLCHDITMQIDSRYNDGYGYWHESAAGDHQDRIRIWGTSRANGGGVDNDALTGSTDANCDIRLNHDATVSDNAGAINQGIWRTRAFSAGNFTAATGSWTVASGDALVDVFRIEGKLLHMHVVLATTTVGTTPSELRVTLPAGKTCNRRMGGVPIHLLDNGTAAFGIAYSTSGDTFVRIIRSDGAAFANATDNTAVGFDVTVEVV